MTDFDANEAIATALKKQTFSQRMEVAQFIHDLISDYYMDNTEIPDAEDVAHWLEAVADNWPVA